MCVCVCVLTRVCLQDEDCLPEAIGWLRDSGAPDVGKKLMDLGSMEIRYRTLSFVFNECEFHFQL